MATSKKERNLPPSVRILRDNFSRASEAKKSGVDILARPRANDRADARRHTTDTIGRHNSSTRQSAWGVSRSAGAKHHVPARYAQNWPVARVIGVAVFKFNKYFSGVPYLFRQHPPKPVLNTSIIIDAFLQVPKPSFFRPRLASKRTASRAGLCAR